MNLQRMILPARNREMPPGFGAALLGPVATLLSAGSADRLLGPELLWKQGTLLLQRGQVGQQPLQMLPLILFRLRSHPALSCLARR